MRKIVFLLPILALIATSCSNKNELTGTTSFIELNGKQIYLLTTKDLDSPFEPTDSVIITDGAFKFTLSETPNGGVGYMVMKDTPGHIPNGIPFVYEKGQIKVTIDSIARVTGTPLNDKSQVFFDKLNVVSEKAEKVGNQLNQAVDETNQQQYISELQAIDKEASGVIFDFLKDNMKNKVGEFYFTHFIDAFQEQQLGELLELASPEYKARMQALMEISPNAADPSQGLVGQSFMDITGPTPEGKNISVSDYVGKNKVVLIDFWASWCGPCIKEMPSVVEAYNKYHAKGFEIVGVSLDGDKDAWVKAIARLKMAWPQMSDLKEWHSDLGKIYNVSSIPYTVLIDQNGKIIAERLTGEDLHSTLEKLLN